MYARGYKKRRAAPKRAKHTKSRRVPRRAANGRFVRKSVRTVRKKRTAVKNAAYWTNYRRKFAKEYERKNQARRRAFARYINSMPSPKYEHPEQMPYYDWVNRPPHVPGQTNIVY
jgi:hypothetical protein